MHSCMKRVMSLFLVVFLVLAFASVVLAAEMSGVVTAVDAAKGTLTLKSGMVDVGFDCESGVSPMIKDLKVGDQVTVQYKEEGGKKKAEKITPMKKKAPVGC